MQTNAYLSKSGSRFAADVCLIVDFLHGLNVRNTEATCQQGSQCISNRATRSVDDKDGKERSLTSSLDAIFYINCKG